MATIYSDTADQTNTIAQIGGTWANIRGDATSASSNYNNTATSGSTVNYVAIVNHLSDGSSADPVTEVLFYGALTNPKEILNGDTMSIATGSLTVSLA